MNNKTRATRGKVRLTILSNEQRQNKKGESPIYVVYTLRDKRFRYLTGKYVKARFWDFKNERIKPQVEDSTTDNETISKIKKQLVNVIDSALTQIPRINPTIDYIKNEMSKQDLTITGKTVLEYFLEWKSMCATKDSPETIKGYKTTYNHLVTFSSSTNYSLTFDNINGEFYDKFTTYFRSKLTKKETNYSENTIGKWIKIIKRFLNWSTRNGYNLYTGYKDFKVTDTTTDFEYITQDEYKKLIKLDLSLFEHYDKVRDIFCVGCNTGLRFGDLMNLKWDNIFFDEKEPEIRIIPLKTGKKDSRMLRIPLMPDTIKIFKKYDDQKKPLPQVTNQKANLYIKTICQMADINNSCNVVKFKGNKRIESSVPKYNRIGMHTVRRTYIIHCLESDMERETVMSITGHKNDATFKRYVQISSQQRNKEMQKLITMRGNHLSIAK